MKKILLILSALLLTAVGASAQVTDVTATYIKNASFEASDTTQLTADETRGYQREEDGDYTGAYTITADALAETGWTLTGSPSIADIMTADASATDNTFGAPGAPSNGVQMLYLRDSWQTNKEVSLSQSVTLPAGDYALTVDTKCISSTSSTGTLVVGNASTALTIHTSNVPDNWDTAEVTFTLAEETEVSFGVNIIFNGGEGSFLIDNFKLYSIEYEYNITSLLANPSFEEVDVEDLTVDSGRCDATEGGAWTVSSLTGWDLVAPAHQNSDYPISDIMSADATSTDNNFGAPGTPSDKTYMLYLRNAHAEQNSNHLDDASVMQALILPAGEYKVTVDSKCIATDANAGTVTLVAGEETTTLTIHTDSAVPTSWDTAVLEFALTETTVVTLGVNIEFTDGSTNYPLSVLLDNFQLFSTEDVEAIDFNYDVTWELANPSFEVDKVANLSEDTTRSTSEEGVYTSGAYTIENGLTGWTLGGSNAVSDLMTEACQRTDNNFGAPGTPADGTQMLYLRNNSSTATGSVKQTITLPAGEYMLTVDTKCVSPGGSTAKLVAGEKSSALTIHTESSIPSAWDTAELILSLDAETEVTVGVEISYGSNGSFLLDNFKLYSVEEITKSIEWEMTSAGWGTMILPFVASIPEGLTLYSGDALTIDGSTITVDTEASSIAANTAYLVKGTAGTYSFSGTPTNEGEIHTTGVLTGTLVDLAVATGAAFATDGTQYLLQNQGDGATFYPIIAESSSEATLDAYHCYLTIESEDGEASPTKLSIVLPGAGETTGIVAVESENLANDAIYDLSGRRVSKAVKGVYIQNGKKVLVK